MKAFISIFHKNHTYEGNLTHLFRSIEKVDKVSDCDVVIMPVTYQPDYVCETEIMNEVEGLGKKIVIVDFIEYGWDTASPNHVLGVNTDKWVHKFSDKFLELDRFIQRNIDNVVLYFKRELVRDLDVKTPFKILPAEYPGVATLPDHIQEVSFEEYNNRPIDIMMVWGLSNPSRPILHGELLKRSALNGQHHVANLDHITYYQKRGDKKMVVLAHVPDFARQSNLTILHLQSLAKISISMNGCGFKCFRHCESSYNSVMAFQENPLQWSYKWQDGLNSIELPNRFQSILIDEKSSYNKMMLLLNKPEDLYNIYLNGIKNWEHYEVNKYSQNYILQEIINVCQ